MRRVGATSAEDYVRVRVERAVEQQTAEAVLASLPEGRAFPYFKDRYALQLLVYGSAGGRGLSEMRRGNFHSLFQKPAVSRLLASRSNRDVGWDLLDSYFPTRAEEYLLTLGLWGDARHTSGWFQTSRPGFNIVVQLNFPVAHDRAYRRLIRTEYGDPFELSFHPVHGRDRRTLAWSRIDYDQDLGEALIEEVQSDWVRYAREDASDALDALIEGNWSYDAWERFRYYEYVLDPHRRIWDEAILGASLWLLRELLGVRTVYMHTHESGRTLKQIGGSGPPRSLYERLPRRFCFERVRCAPRFLEAERHEFWRLEL